MTQHAIYLSQRSLDSKHIIHTHSLTHTHWKIWSTLLTQQLLTV